MGGKSIEADWAMPRISPSFIGHVRESTGTYQAGTYIRCVNIGGAVPCTLDKFNANPKVRLVASVLHISKIGTSYAPFKTKGKDGKSIRDKTAQNLAEPVGSNGVKIYSYGKVKSNMEKGPRDDSMYFNLQVGQTITCMLRDFMYNGERDVFANDQGDAEIPPFAVMDIVISPTNNEDPK